MDMMQQCCECEHHVSPPDKEGLRFLWEEWSANPTTYDGEMREVFTGYHRCMLNKCDKLEVGKYLYTKYGIGVRDDTDDGNRD